MFMQYGIKYRKSLKLIIETNDPDLNKELYVLLRPCCPVASLEVMYLLNPSKTFTLYHFIGIAVKLGGHQSKF
jgi:hypothetical protein